MKAIRHLATPKLPFPSMLSLTLQTTTLLWKSLRLFSSVPGVPITPESSAMSADLNDERESRWHMVGGVGAGYAKCGGSCGNSSASRRLIEGKTTIGPRSIWGCYEPATRKTCGDERRFLIEIAFPYPPSWKVESYHLQMGPGPPPTSNAISCVD